MMVVLDEVTDTHPDENVLVVSHGGAMLAVVSFLAPGTPDHPARSRDFTECEVVELVRDNGVWQLTAVAD